MRDFITKHLEEFKDLIVEMGGNVFELTIEQHATLAELHQIEEKLIQPLPKDLKEFALTVSRSIKFSWMLPEDCELPDEFDEIMSGELEYDIFAIPDNEKMRADWQRDVCPNADDSYDVIWHNKLGFHHVPNGDCLGFDEEGRVIYLSHEDGDGHGIVMASSFSELMRQWIPLGCPGPEDWLWLPFITDNESGIQSEGEFAKKWLNFLRKKP